MTDLYLKVSENFSETPGARYYKDGPYSGEEFYDKCLSVFFEKAIQEDKLLIVDLDGTYGFATSFISESFGNLVKNFGKKNVQNRIRIISIEDEDIKKFAMEVIQNGKQD